MVLVVEVLETGGWGMRAGATPLPSGRLLLFSGKNELQVTTMVRKGSLNFKEVSISIHLKLKKK